jgi:molecular chaperone GrpE (heat shock protein)
MTSELETLTTLLTKELKEKVDLRNDLKQTELEKQDLMKDFCLGIIKVIDSFESKEENLTERYAEAEAAKKTIKSYNSIKKQLLNILKNHGVTLLEFPEKRLIVGFSKVVDTEPDKTKSNDEIISIVKNGYIRGSDLMREAELIVVKN